jgi:Outer membrane protein beta-barrel domain
MKSKFILYTFSLLAISVSSFAQIKPIIKAGAINNTWKGEAKQTFISLIDQTNGIITEKDRIGFYAGAGVNIPLGSIVSVEPSLVYTQRGYAIEGNLTINQLKIEALNASATSQMHYIDLPVLLKVKPVGGLTIFAGPQVSYLVKNNLRADVSVLGFSVVNTNLTITNQFNKWDMGVTGGIGYEFAGGIGITAAYDRGFRRLDQNQRFKVFNEGIKAGLTYRF